MSTYTIRRRIDIDAGHRIMTHGSKCRHLHGHRYGIEAVCEAESLSADGEQAGMVLDFGFLKDEMMIRIDRLCDHGFIAAVTDHDLLALFAPEGEEASGWIRRQAEIVARDGACPTTETRLATRLYLVPFQPTAECLARHWFEVLDQPVRQRSNGRARLIGVRVWETPNCMAEYTP